MHRKCCLFKLPRVNNYALLLRLLVMVCIVNMSLQTASKAASHSENAFFSAAVTSVETSLGSNGWRYLTVSVHLQNLTKKPLILGVEPGKVHAVDDQHNTYTVVMVRGIGEITGTRVDAKFMLPGGEGGDTLFEMRWRGERNIIFGTMFDITLPIHTINSLDSGQVKLGPEYIMTFTGLKAGYTASPDGSQSLPENTVNAGPFTFQITRMTPSISGNHRIQSAAFAVKIQNNTSKPLVLAYEGTSSFGVDDQGNRFGYGTAGTHDTSASGIGILTSISADPQFVLAPGESREVQLSVMRRLGRETAGTSLTYYVALAQLEVLPGNQIRTVRQYSLTFPRMKGLN